MNNPQKVEEIVRDYEDGELLIDWHAHDDLASIIRKDRLAHKTAMLEAIKGEKEKLATYGALNARRAGHNIKKILAIGKLQALDRAEDIINKIYE